MCLSRSRNFASGEIPISVVVALIEEAGDRLAREIESQLRRGDCGAAERIGAELRQQYVIGFAPAHPGDGKFHKVQVTVNGCPRCRVRTRSGYIADPVPGR